MKSSLSLSLSLSTKQNEPTQVLNQKKKKKTERNIKKKKVQNFLFYFILFFYCWQYCWKKLLSLILFNLSLYLLILLRVRLSVPTIPFRFEACLDFFIIDLCCFLTCLIASSFNGVGLHCLYWFTFMSLSYGNGESGPLGPHPHTIFNNSAPTNIYI